MLFKGAFRTHRLRKLSPVVVGAVCLAPFVSLLKPSELVPSGSGRDYALMHLPLARFACDELLSGRLPLWNPYLACGQPLQAAQQAMLFYPLAMPFCLLLGANCGLKFSIFLHLVLYYTGSYFLARRVGISIVASAYSALTVTWSGAMLGQIADGHLGAVFAAALAPWFFLALADSLRAPGFATAARLALLGALCSLVAQPQVFYYTLVAGALFTTVSLTSGAASIHRFSAVRWAILAALVAMLIAGVQLVPAIELMRDGMGESDRGTQKFAGHFALAGADAFRLLMPYLNGTPFAGLPQFDRSDQYHERVVYLGICAPLLAIYGLSRANVARWQWAVAGGTVLSLAIAFGESTPVFALLGKALPGLLLFRCPGRVFMVASLPAALLAGRGLDALAQGWPRAGARQLRRLAGLLSVSLCVPVYAAAQSAQYFDWQCYVRYARHFLLDELVTWSLLTLDTFLVLAIAVIGARRGLPMLLAIGVITAVDLGHFNVGNFYLQTDKPYRFAQLPVCGSNTRFVEGHSFDRLDDLSLRYSRLTATALYEHCATVSTYDGGVLPAATARLYRSMRAHARTSLALAACSFACAVNGRTIQYSNFALPRVRFVRAGDPSVELPVDLITANDIQELKQSARPAVQIGESSAELRIEVDASADGWLVVSDTYYPGWVCRVDGHFQTIQAAHDVFRRVWLRAGMHTVLMTYEPLSFRIGACCTFAGGVIAIAMALAGQHSQEAARGQHPQSAIPEV